MSYCSQCMYYRPSTDNPCAAPPGAKCIGDKAQMLKALKEAIGRGEIVLSTPNPLGLVMGFSHVKEKP